MDRRDFVKTALTSAAALAAVTSRTMARTNWEIGCFNRPWTKWPFDQTLKEIKAAGYKSTGLLTRTKDEPFNGPAASPEYLESLKQRIKASGLTVNLAALHSRHSIPLEESILEVRKQIDNARFLSSRYIMSFGTDKAEEFDHYIKVMSDAAAYAQEKGVRLVMKPHGGISGASSEILRVIKEVNHRNFSIWYDAGNIIYYTGKDPVAEIAPIAKHISGFCAKDCGSLKGDVMIQFGTGKVDFPAVFKMLKTSGFSGPVMVECCQVGETPEATSANARANLEFLEKILAAI
ncbi:MAG: sugar phosphate isomerase/epimerase family protein [Acidobacteriota bacterium]